MLQFMINSQSPHQVSKIDAVRVVSNDGLLVLGYCKLCEIVYSKFVLAAIFACQHTTQRTYLFRPVVLWFVHNPSSTPWRDIKDKTVFTSAINLFYIHTSCPSLATTVYIA